jgi:putative integral membrane protein (TIGR02587 family)
MARDGRRTGVSSPAQSLREYARGIAGGLLFSLPLLYTMEVWWAGFIARPLNLLVYFAVGFVLLFGYNRYAGLHEDAGWLDVAFEAVEEMGLGLVLAALLLWLLGQIDSTSTLSEVVGKVVVEAVVVAIGISVGSSQLGGNGKQGQGMRRDRGDEGPLSLPAQLVLGACGAILLASNVAPTEEIVMIAIESSRAKILALALFSYLLGALVLFYSGFHGTEDQLPPEGQGPGTALLRSAVNYSVALVASAFILWFFGRFSGMSLAVCVSQTVVLGFVASLGAAVGRLLLQ